MDLRCNHNHYQNHLYIFNINCWRTRFSTRIWLFICSTHFCIAHGYIDIILIISWLIPMIFIRWMFTKYRKKFSIISSIPSIITIIHFNYLYCKSKRTNLWIYFSNNKNASKSPNFIRVHFWKNSCYYFQRLNNQLKGFYLLCRSKKAASGPRRAQAKSWWGLKGKQS